MEKQVKSGKEILEEFFSSIQSLENVDKKLAQSLVNLYKQGKLTDANVKNEIQQLREQDGDKD
jgi:flagellin-specific chaperone FliS